jgi:hypothetical protein
MLHDIFLAAFIYGQKIGYRFSSNSYGCLIVLAAMLSLSIIDFGKLLVPEGRKLCRYYSYGLQMLFVLL